LHRKIFSLSAAQHSSDFIIALKLSLTFSPRPIGLSYELRPLTGQAKKERKNSNTFEHYDIIKDYI
jgi:hypothetical protein